MAAPNEKLAEALEVLRKVQERKGSNTLHTSEVSRVHRERLVTNGFLRDVSKGWYIISDPNDQAGDTTAWYTSYWDFCSRYLNRKYGERYVVSAEQSILLHTGNQTVPEQLIIKAEEGSNQPISMLHGTSILALKIAIPDEKNIEVKNKVRCYTLAFALTQATEKIYEKNATEMRLALAQVSDSSEVTRILLEGSHSVIAGRLAGAFRNIGRTRIADDIIRTMTAADFKVREVDPFKRKSQIVFTSRERSPYVNRIRLMWAKMRDVVLKHFPEEPGMPISPEGYLKSIDEIYVTDSYHSLSIERYQVSVELIEKVRSGDWNLNKVEDQEHRNALAARGYFQATQIVKQSIERILNNENPGVVTDEVHNQWYQQLFAPSVTAGILTAGDLAGYRNRPIFISNSRHVPMNREALIDVMPTLFDLIAQEKHVGVRAVLGHFIFVYIHPYADGNGRMGRFLFNTMLASGGYPWTVIPVEQRKRYMSSLEQASVHENIEPFAKFLSYLVDESLKGTPVASLK